MSDSTPTLVERVALAVGDKLGGFDGAGELYRNNGDVRWKQSLEIARAALDASGNDELEPARPLIEAIAAWEREHGTVAAIMPDEYADFCQRISRAAIRGSARAAIARTQEQSDGE